MARKLLEGASFYRFDIDPVLKELLEAREVDREREQRGARLLWVYFARRELEGPIVDLDRAFREGEAEGETAG